LTRCGLPCSPTKTDFTLTIRVFRSLNDRLLNENHPSHKRGDGGERDGILDRVLFNRHGRRRIPFWEAPTPAPEPTQENGRAWAMLDKERVGAGAHARIRVRPAGLKEPCRVASLAPAGG
jgi:hypothetical protein